MARSTLSIALVLLVLLLLPPQAAAPAAAARQVRWWTNFESAGVSAQLETIAQHPRSITGIYTYIGAGHGDSGAFSFGHSPSTDNNYTWIREAVRRYTALGLTVTPAVSLTNHSVMSGTALAHVSEAAAFAKAANVSGLMLDFEPATSEVPWVLAYAKYVKAFTAALHAVGLEAEMCVSDWGILDGHFLKNGEGYGVFAKTGVDTMMSMAGTYYGTNVSKNEYNVELELKQDVALSQLAAGVGCHETGGRCYNWTEARFRDFGSFLVGKGVTQLDIWRADIDKPTDCTEPWVFEVAEQFLNGTLPPPTSASPLGA